MINNSVDNILTISALKKTYSQDETVLDGVSFGVPRGTIYGLLGPNGAGKSTLLRIINHIIVADEGDVMMDGKKITSELVRTAIGYMPEERGLYRDMEVGEQAMFFARLRGMSTDEAEENVLECFERLDICDWWYKRVKDLSKGMAQRVQFAIATMHRPPLLILDEPFSGCDPIAADLLRREILWLKENGTTILLSTHDMNIMEQLCDRITLLSHGRVLLSGAVDEMRALTAEADLTINELILKTIELDEQKHK